MTSTHDVFSIHMTLAEVACIMRDRRALYCLHPCMVCTKTHCPLLNINNSIFIPELECNPMVMVPRSSLI